MATLVTLALPARATPLDDKLKAIAKTTRASLGIYVEHVERHEAAGWNATRPFPLASTFKLPLAVVVLRLIDRQELPGLDSHVRVEKRDLWPGASSLNERMPTGGSSTLRELMTAMLETSDNTAANALMRICGGAARVQATLVALGFAGISLDRDETEMSLDAHGLPYPAPADRNPQKLAVLKRNVRVFTHQQALAAFLRDPRDHGQPLMMTKLIERLWQQDLLSAAALDFVREELGRNRGGVRRIRAGVPAGVAVADRSGTCDGIGDDEAACINDVGLITLPSGEHVALAVYVADAGGPIDVKERLIADVTRVVWNYFVKTKDGKN
ncbi:MAG TPA: class A beta-lactamase [Polyangia bacterium]|nr:class A beta-lactamase [Polyangia bacterium]